MLSNIGPFLSVSSSFVKRDLNLLVGRERCGIRRAASISRTVLVDMFYPRIVGEFGSSGGDIH